MGFLVDSDLWISVERRRISPADLHAFTRQEPVYLSPVNIAEITFGIHRMKDSAQRQRAIATLRRLRRKPLLKITAQTAEVFGTLAAELAKTGRSHDFRVQDLWLAAQTVQRDFTLLTANAKDFKDVPGLEFLEVRVPGR